MQVPLCISAHKSKGLSYWNQLAWYLHLQHKSCDLHKTNIGFQLANQESKMEIIKCENMKFMIKRKKHKMCTFFLTEIAEKYLRIIHNILFTNIFTSHPTELAGAIWTMPIPCRKHLQQEYGFPSNYSIINKLHQVSTFIKVSK